MPTSTSLAAPSATSTFSFYQLENLHRQQAKFLMVALTGDEASGAEPVPQHPLLRIDLVAEGATASAKIQQTMRTANYPLWWPVVLISTDGVMDRSVMNDLSALGYLNVFSFKDGWNSLNKESPRPS